VGSERAAASELGGERGLAQRFPGYEGDSREVGVAGGQEVSTSGVPRRVRGSEQPGGPAGLAVECLRAGQAGEGLRHERVAEIGGLGV